MFIAMGQRTAYSTAMPLSVWTRHVLLSFSTEDTVFRNAGKYVQGRKWSSSARPVLHVELCWTSGNHLTLSSHLVQTGSKETWMVS